MNLFDLGKQVSASSREYEQGLVGAVQLFEYVLGALLGGEMTAKQGIVLRFLIRLLISIDGATLNTLREVLEKPERFKGEMRKLPELARDFFINEFCEKQFKSTREQVLRRVYMVLDHPVFGRVFGAKENKLDLYQALNRGRVVLVNTSREVLGEECKVFGRYMIALAMRAAFDRARIPEDKRRASFLYIDEASDYFDEGVGQLLVQARKYRLGVTLAYQSLVQLSTGLRDIVMTNTSVKMAGGVSAKDARLLATEMQTTPEFILAQTKDRSSSGFAAYARNLSTSAVTWRVPFGTVERLPKMSAFEFEAMLARNRAEVCGRD